jgi:bifunctional DNase/RNase
MAAAAGAYMITEQGWWRRESRLQEVAMTAMTDVGFVRMRISKVVGVRDGDRVCEFVVLDEPGGNRHLLIQIGQIEAFALAANLGEMEWGRPMTYQFMAQLVRSLGGRIREVRLDGLVAGAYAATVEVEGPQGVELVDARSSDALNLAVLTAAPILAALEVLEDSDRRQEGDSAEAVLTRRALAAPPMTITRLDP